jgi:hypothetical protein
VSTLNRRRQAPGAVRLQDESGGDSMSSCYEEYLGDEHEEAECETCGADIVVVTSWKAGWLEPMPRHNYKCEECGGPWEAMSPPKIRSRGWRG